MELIRAIEATLATENLDDFFEFYLTHLFKIAKIRMAEIRLFNEQDHLVLVAAAKWVGPDGNRVLKVWTENWVLDHPVKRTCRRTPIQPLQPVFSFPLVHATGLAGFINIQMDQLEFLSRDQLNQLYVVGLQVAAKIREIRLNQEITGLKTELDTLIQTNREIRQQSTSLSKELYAISAISTKINQSMDFGKSLRKSIATTLKVFDAAVIMVYIRDDPHSRLELAATEYAPGHPDKTLPKSFRKLIESRFLPAILKSGKPLVTEQVPEWARVHSDAGTAGSAQYLVGSLLTAKERAVGVLILLYTTARAPGFATLRLLSGMANIMAMAIENMQLYNQSVQKKSEAAFLFQSIVKFNETLNLNAVLKSVAEKGAEFCGPPTRVYVLSEMRLPFIMAGYEPREGAYKLTSVCSKSFSSPVLKQLFDLLMGRLHKGSARVKKLGPSKMIPRQMKAHLQEAQISSLIGVPLRVGKHKFGLLLLVRAAGQAPFKRNEQVFAEALASAASLAIENARSYNASQEMSGFLEKKISEKNSQIDHIQAKQQRHVENRRELLFQVNKHNRFIFVNKAMEVLSGLPREVLCHKDFRASEVVAPQDRQRVEQCFRRVLKNEVSMVKDVEYRHLNRNGEACIISLTISPEIGQNGRICGVEGVGLDITEQKKLASELKKTKEIALLGEFSSAVAHQMRNPLGNILMSTARLQKELIAAAPRSADIQAEARGTAPGMRDTCSTTIDGILRNLSEGVYNLNQVVTELLEYTKTLKPRRTFQRINIVLAETLQRFKDTIQQNNIIVSCHFDCQLPPVLLDTVLIGQALQNIIHNAIQAMPDGGTLELSTGLSKEREDHLLLSIKDSGQGIDPREMDKIFRPFYTTKAQGTGLGLSLAHRIVEAHAGTLWACADSGRSAAPAPEKNDTGNDDGHPRGTTMHILIPWNPV
jgi:PAS domain S-box-containing protein